MAATPGPHDTSSSEPAVVPVEYTDTDTRDRCPRCGQAVSPVKNEYWCINCARDVTPVAASEIVIEPGDSPAGTRDSNPENSAESCEHPTGKPPEMRSRLENRFWSKVDVGEKDECWEWREKHNTNPNGYGYFWIGDTVGKRTAHRVALALDKGLTNPDKLEGDVVRHLCGGPKTCCNPRHLETGTQRDNMDDYVTREMDPETDREYSAEDIREIRRLAAESPMTQRGIADKYGMSQQMVSEIVRGEQYDWVD